MANLYIAIALYRPTVADTYMDDRNIKMNLGPDTWPGRADVIKKKGNELGLLQFLHYNIILMYSN